MPLDKSGSKESVGNNIRAERDAGKPQKQAVAIALDVARRARRDSGGGVLAERHKSPSIVPQLGADVAGRHLTGGAGRFELGKATGPKNSIERTGQNVYRRELRRSPSDGSYRQMPADTGGGEGGSAWDSFTTPLRDRADGGNVPWYVRNEARNINTTGALHSPVPGRTDHLPVNVPPGSYVLPADLVSGVGQGNTTSGIQSLNSMFFGSGPLGVKSMKGGRGKGPPRAKAPRPAKFADGGLAGADMSAEPMQPMQDQMPDPDAGQEDQEGVPIMAAGGEFIIPPHKVAEIGGGDIAIGHDILDMFVQDMRKDLIKTLSKLPGPAKD